MGFRTLQLARYLGEVRTAVAGGDGDSLADCLRMYSNGLVNAAKVGRAADAIDSACESLRDTGKSLCCCSRGCLSF